MTNEVKVAITNAVYEVYKNTTEPYHADYNEKTIEYSVPSSIGGLNRVARIARVKDARGIYYILFVGDDKNPFMTVFGCWPIGFVADVFIRALEHYHDWY